MKYGTKVHHILELDDFSNPVHDESIKFLNRYNNKPEKVYKEYEFVYEENNTINHGIIDLMFEYDDFIDIIDYKLSEIEDEAYNKQLLGYKTYIESKTNKKVNTYLYSIMKDELKKIDL